MMAKIEGNRYHSRVETAFPQHDGFRCLSRHDGVLPSGKSRKTEHRRQAGHRLNL